MDIRPIRTEADYNWALAQIETYLSSEPDLGTPDADRFEVLATLIEAYEAIRWPVPTCEPVDLLHYAIEHMGRSQADLADIIGSRSHASEVLSRKRAMSIDMIRRISEAWRLPVDLLLGRSHSDAA